MLKDEVKKIKEAMPGYVITAQGGCLFCGQIIALEVDPTWKQEELDELATELCDCTEAGAYTYTKKRREKAKKCIKEQFQEEIKENENIKHLLNVVTDMVINEEIRTFSCDINGKIKAKISMTAKGNVKIERTETEKKSEET